MKIVIAILCLIACLETHAQLEKRQDTNKKFGFTDEQGDWVIKPTYEAAEEFFDLRFAFVKSKGKWILIDRSGSSVLPFTYDKIIDFGDEEKRTVMRNGRYGIVDLLAGIEMVESKYDNPLEISDSYFNGDEYILVKENNRIGLLTSSGQALIPPLYDPVRYPFEDTGFDLFKVWQNKKAGLIDNGGKLIVPCQFDQVYISEVGEGTINTKSKNKYGLYSYSGNEIVAPLYDAEIRFDNPEFAIVKQQKKYGVINKEGILVVPCNYTTDDEAFLKWESLQEKE